MNAHHWHAIAPSRSRALFATQCLVDGWEVASIIGKTNTILIGWNDLVLLWPHACQRAPEFPGHWGAQTQLRSPFYPLCSVQDLVFLAFWKAFAPYNFSTAEIEPWNVPWQPELTNLLSDSKETMEAELVLFSLWSLQ